VTINLTKLYVPILEGVLRGIVIETISPIATADPETKVTLFPEALVLTDPLNAWADPPIANKLVLGAIEETPEGNSM
jgi:hypothetical protein